MRVAKYSVTERALSKGILLSAMIFPTFSTDGLSGGNRSVVLLQNHGDDFVGGLIGNNPATYDQRPKESSRLKEWYRVFGDAPTVHSCYGTGAVDAGCSNYGAPITVRMQFWGKPGDR